MMGKNKVMQLANVDGFFWALSAHEVIPHPYPHPRPAEDRTGIPILPSGAVQLHDGGGFSRAQSAGEVTPRSKEGRLTTLPTRNWVCSIIFHVDWYCDN